MQRSSKDAEETLVDVLDESGKSMLGVLSRLAFNGLFGEGSRDVPRLVFTKPDFDVLSVKKEESKYSKPSFH